MQIGKIAFLLLFYKLFFTFLKFNFELSVNCYNFSIKKARET